MIETLNSYGRVWAEYFVWAVVQNTLFLGLVFVVLYWMRNASAKVKHAIAAVGLVKLLLPPFVPSHVLTPAGQSLPLPTSTLLFSFADSPAVGPPPAVMPSIGIEPLGAMLLIWLVGASAILVRSIIMTGRLATAVNDAVPVDDAPLASTNARKTRVYKTDRIDIPLTIGFLPHRIFVPTAWDRWTPECRSAVLKHELAHIDRRDGLYQALEIVVQALYFFHPMVLILNQRLREYREMACDDISSGRERASRLDYSRFLVELAETATRPSAACDSASALLRRKNELFKRVAYQMKEEQMLTVSNKKVAVVLVALIVAAVPLSLHLGGGGVGADEAIAGSKTKTEKSSSGLHRVDVALKGKAILIDGKKTSLESFSHAMNTATNGNTDGVVVHITCHPDATMASLFEVQRRMLDLGLYKVSYANDVVAELPVMLPTKDLKKKMQQISQEDIVSVRIEASGKVLFNKAKADKASMTEELQKSLQSNPNLIVSVYMDDKTRYEDFVSVLAHIKKAGADRIFINDPA